MSFDMHISMPHFKGTQEGQNISDNTQGKILNSQSSYINTCACEIKYENSHEIFNVNGVNLIMVSVSHDEEN